MTAFLIFGKGGMLAHALLQELDDYVALSIDDVDITDEQAVKKAITDTNPKCVINAAAITDVDGCEKNKEQAMSVNGHAPGFIAKVCGDLDITFFHISTDYVFQGDNKNGYKEDEEKNPLGVYGESKALAEDLIIKNTSKYFIIRTAWLFGENGKNFVETIIRLSKEKDQLTVVDDQIGCPTYTRDLAKIIKGLSKSKDYGIYHITNSGSCSWYEFAKTICKSIKSDVDIAPIPSSKLNRLAKRPAYSVLINTKTDTLRSWQEALQNYLERREEKE